MSDHNPLDPKGSAPGSAARAAQTVHLSPDAEREVVQLAERVFEKITNHLEAFTTDKSSSESLLTKQQVADRLLVSPRTVHTLMSEGRLVPTRVRGQIRFTPESVAAYLRSETRGKQGGRK